MTIQESLEKTARLIEAIDEHSTRQNQKTKLALETAEAEFDPTNLRCLKEAIHMVSSGPKRQMVKATIAGGYSARYQRASQSKRGSGSRHEARSRSA